MLGCMESKGCAIAAKRDPPAPDGRGTMNLLMSDTALAALPFEDMVSWQPSLIEYAYVADPARDGDEYEAVEASR